MREIKFRAWDKIRNEWVDSLYTDDLLNPRMDNSPWILMQYTGLKDKNGVEIYEGGILAVDGLNGFQQVMWTPGRISIRTVPDNDDFSDLWEVAAVYMEVIGNIYENPDLIKE